MPETVSFGAWIKQRRRELDLTQKEIARQIGCASSTIEKIEQGVLRPSRQIAALLAEQLEISPEEYAAFVQWARLAPSRALPAAPLLFTTLPIPLTRLIGREDDLARLYSLLSHVDTRLVTLTGPGGTGKTRLALHTAADLLDDFSHGVCFVELSAITDATLVVPAIAQVLEVKEAVGQAISDTLKTYLREKRLLLLLDNFEQVVEAAADVSQLLWACPGLKVLATSRVPLRVRGEKEYAVPPLELPDIKELPPIERLTECDAVRLFMDRAADVRADFYLTDSNARSVAEICVRLDGLPLAIELAAAHVKMLSPHALLTRLSHRLALLTGGARDLTARQQTLRATLDWSYDLLDEAHKQFFRRMAVFMGGRTLEALEAVCNSEALQAYGRLQVEVFDGAETLLSNNLLQQREGSDGELRFWMLETIQEYASEKLEGSGEAAAIRRAHALYFVRLVEEAEPHLRGPEQVEWLDRLEMEHNNIRAALLWCLRGGHSAEDVDTALRMIGGLYLFWDIRGYVREGRRQAEAVLRHTGAEWVSTGRAKALLTASRLTYFQREHAAARDLAEESLAVWRKLGDKRGIISALEGLGLVAWHQGDIEMGEPLLEESLAIRKEIRYDLGITELLALLSYVAVSRREYSKAIGLVEEYMPLVKTLGDQRGTAVLYHTSAYALLGLGDYETCVEHFSNSLTLTKEVGDRQGIGWSLTGFAEVELVRHHPLRAARLLGAAEALLQSLGIPPAEHAIDREMYLHTVSATREMLGETRFDEEWAGGRTMSTDQAISYALECPGVP